MGRDIQQLGGLLQELHHRAIDVRAAGPHIWKDVEHTVRYRQDNRLAVYLFDSLMDLRLNGHIITVRRREKLDELVRRNDKVMKEFFIVLFEALDRLIGQIAPHLPPGPDGRPQHADAWLLCHRHELALTPQEQEVLDRVEAHWRDCYDVIVTMGDEEARQYGRKPGLWERLFGRMVTH